VERERVGGEQCVSACVPVKTDKAPARIPPMPAGTSNLIFPCLLCPSRKPYRREFGPSRSNTT